MSELCEDCGGPVSEHPWPSSGPYVRGCIAYLRSEIQDLKILVEGLTEPEED